LKAELPNPWIADQFSWVARTAMAELAIPM